MRIMGFGLTSFLLCSLHCEVRSTSLAALRWRVEHHAEAATININLAFFPAQLLCSGSEQSRWVCYLLRKEDTVVGGYFRTCGGIRCGKSTGMYRPSGHTLSRLVVVSFCVAWRYQIGGRVKGFGQQLDGWVGAEGRDLV